MSISITLLTNLINNATTKRLVRNFQGQYREIIGEDYYIKILYKEYHDVVCHEITLKIGEACWIGEVLTTNFRFGHKQNWVRLDDHVGLFLDAIKTPFKSYNLHELSEDQIANTMMTIMRYA